MFCLSPARSSLLFLQVDNRPCARLTSTCFPKATEAASFLRAAVSLKPSPFHDLPELAAVIGIRGLQHEIGSRDEETGREEVKGKPTRPVSGTHAHTAFIQTKHYEALFSFQRVDMLETSVELQPC